MGSTLSPASVYSEADAVGFDRAGRHLTAYVSGELDQLSAPAVTEAILRQIRPDDQRLWVDMSATTFCDSSGLKMLFDLRNRVEAHDGNFIVYSPAPQVRRVIEICDPDHSLAVRA